MLFQDHYERYVLRLSSARNFRAALTANSLTYVSAETGAGNDDPEWTSVVIAPSHAAPRAYRSPLTWLRGVVTSPRSLNMSVSENTIQMMSWMVGTLFCCVVGILYRAVTSISLGHWLGIIAYLATLVLGGWCKDILVHVAQESYTPRRHLHAKALSSFCRPIATIICCATAIFGVSKELDRDDELVALWPPLMMMALGNTLLGYSHVIYSGLIRHHFVPELLAITMVLPVQLVVLAYAQAEIGSFWLLFMDVPRSALHKSFFSTMFAVLVNDLFLHTIGTAWSAALLSCDCCCADIQSIYYQADGRRSPPEMRFAAELASQLFYTYRSLLPTIPWYCFMRPTGIIEPANIYLCIKLTTLVPACIRVARLLRQAIKKWRGDPRYGRFANSAELKKQLQSKESEGACSVCTEPFSNLARGQTDEHSAVVLSCGHVFCQGCLDEWLRQHNTCPMCRATVEGANPARSEAVTRGGASVMHLF
jgi:hypothetical protein